MKNSAETAPFSISISAQRLNNNPEFLAYFKRLASKINKRINEGDKDLRQVYAIDVVFGRYTAYIWCQGTMSVFWFTMPPCGIVAVGYEYYPVPNKEVEAGYAKAPTHSEKEYLRWLKKFQYQIILILNTCEDETKN